MAHPAESDAATGPDTASRRVGAGDRRVAFDNLRAVVVALVVLHHAILAYVTFAFLNSEHPARTFSPVVDGQRWSGFDLIAIFNDTFLMALMFFVAGLFTWRSLSRRGAAEYLGVRFRRLGLPFVVGVVVLMPLAYYAAQRNVDLVFGGHTTLGAFWLDMVRSGFGTAGPLWFLWLLLAFGCIITVLYRLAPDLGAAIRARAIGFLERPLALFLVLLGLSTIAYLPLAVAFDPTRWVGFGPFQLQISRLLFYLVYFLFGTVIGAYGIDRSALRTDGPLAGRWWGWMTAGWISYVVFLVIIIQTARGEPRPILGGIAFTVCCATNAFMVMALCLRYASRRSAGFESLSANAYGIYVVHYVFVLWLQFGLLGLTLPALVKGIVAFVGSLLLSWATVALLRRIPAVAKVV